MLKNISLNKPVYFDNAATTFPKPEEVYVFMDEFYRGYGVNVGRGQHKLAFAANNLVEETRQLLLNLFHCPNKTAVFTHTATEAINIILRGLAFKDNYNIYLSPFEHNAVTRVIHHLKESYLLNTRTLAVDEISLKYDLERISRQFADNPPDVMVVSHASNVCGVLAPIAEICALSKQYEAVNIIDMCQTAGLIDTDLSSEQIDFAIFAGHKTLYGPLGAAGFITSGKIKPAPLLFGGTGIDSANLNLPNTIPEMYEVASPNILSIAGVYAALKWIKKRGINHIYEKEKIHHKKLLDVLGKFDNIKIISPAAENLAIGVVSCTFAGFSGDNIGQILSDHAIAVRTGLHCAPMAHKFLKTSPAGTVRFSVGYFNDNTDFYKLEKVLEYIEENS